MVRTCRFVLLPSERKPCRDPGKVGRKVESCCAPTRANAYPALKSPQALKPSPRLPWPPLQDFIRALDKSFLFEPGTGGAYSSVGFVLAGLVLAAATGAPTWEQLDQRAALFGPRAAAAGLREADIFAHNSTSVHWVGIYDPETHRGCACARLFKIWDAHVFCFWTRESNRIESNRNESICFV